MDCKPKIHGLGYAGQPTFSPTTNCQLHNCRQIDANQQIIGRCVDAEIYAEGRDQFGDLLALLRDDQVSRLYCNAYGIKDMR